MERYSAVKLIKEAPIEARAVSLIKHRVKNNKRKNGFEQSGNSIMKNDQRN